jgi:tetratricopeptide (TPR) repeat protein
MGYLFEISGNAEQASKMYSRARDIGDLPDADKVPDLGKALMARGDKQFNNSDYSAAADDLRESLRLTSASHPDNSKYSAEVKFDVAELYAAIGDFASASKMSSEASAIFEQAPGDNRYARGRVLVQIATLLVKSGELSRAIDFLKQAIALLDQPLPEYNDNPNLRLLDVSICNYRLAQAEAGVGNHVDAKSHFDLTLDYYSRLFGGDSVQVADVLVQTLMNSKPGNSEDAGVTRRVEGIVAQHQAAESLPILQGLASYYVTHAKPEIALRTETLASSALNSIIKTNLEGMSAGQQQLCKRRSNTRPHHAAKAG